MIVCFILIKTVKSQNMKIEISNEEINIRIAELMGLCLSDDKKQYYHDEHGSWISIPSYITDLNAIHEVLKTMRSDGHWSRYQKNLRIITNTYGQPELTAWMIEHNASARSRAIAILKTEDEMANK